MLRRQDDNYDRQLRELNAPGIQSDLPLVHVTSAWSGKEIVRLTKIKTSFCNVFKTELLYFFVLRPAYCLRNGEEPSHYIDYFPAAFVVKSQAVQRPRHIFPFDTGAAWEGHYASQANLKVPLDDYELAPEHSAAAGFIGWAFRNLRRYYEGRLRPDIADGLKVTDSVAHSYIAVARLGLDGDRHHDKRASTLEVASSHNVDLLENCPLIIFPKAYLEDKRLKPYFDKLWQHGSQLEPYDWDPSRTPNEFQKDMMQICRRWYLRHGLDL